MKSAYELAMERFKDEDDASPPLTAEQKAALAEIDKKYQARIAEREVFLNGQLQAARKSRNSEEFGRIEKQLRNEKLRLEEEKEAAKDKVRSGA